MFVIAQATPGVNTQEVGIIFSSIQDEEWNRAVNGYAPVPKQEGRACQALPSEHGLQPYHSILSWGHRNL